jgi:hypothetical protein
MRWRVSRGSVDLGDPFGISGLLMQECIGFVRFAEEIGVGDRGQAKEGL